MLFSRFYAASMKIVLLALAALLTALQTAAQKSGDYDLARLGQLFYGLDMYAAPAAAAERLRNDTAGRFMLVEWQGPAQVVRNSQDTLPPKESYRFRLSENLNAEYKADSSFIDCYFYASVYSSSKGGGKLISIGISNVSIVMHFSDSATAAKTFATQKARLDSLFPGGCYESNIIQIHHGIVDDYPAGPVVGQSCSIVLRSDDRRPFPYEDVRVSFHYRERMVYLHFSKRVDLTPE